MKRKRGEDVIGFAAIEFITALFCPLFRQVGAGAVDRLRDIPQVAFGMKRTATGYFDCHHTNADTLDKIDPRDFRKCVATLAVMAYILADMLDRL